MVTLIARVTHVPGSDGTVDWFGTSMGGLIGMVLASIPGNPIRKLVLNDIGPIIDPVALARIGDYIGQDLRFTSFEEGAAFVRAVSASFGPHSDAEWHKLAADVLRQGDDGQWRRHYDMALAEPFQGRHASHCPARRSGTVGRLRCHHVPHAAGARGRLRFIIERDSADDDAARPEAAAG